MKIENIFIFARGGSKEIKNKNIIKIKGKPLIEYSIRFAKNLKIKNIFISTNSSKIKKIAKKNKTNVIDRPEKLASDISPEILSWKHAIKWYEKIYKKKIDNFISLPVTSPLRKKIDFKNAYNLFIKSGSDMVISIYKPNHFPSFNIVKKDKGNIIKIYDSLNNVSRRQSVNNVYNIATCFYIAKRDYVMRTKYLFSGKISGYIVDEKSAFDLDSKFQLKLLRKII